MDAKQPKPRITKLATGATVALLALVIGFMLAIAGSGALATGGASITFKQTPKLARFTAKNVDQLLPGSSFDRACWELTARATRARSWCAERTAPNSKRWRLVGSARGAKLSLAGPSATLSIDPQRAAVAPGLYKWSFSISSCIDNPSGATGSTGGTGVSGPSAATPTDCTQRIPISGGETVRIHSVIAAGCKVRGAAQVTTGPRPGKRIALTFDDGPAPDTSQFLRELRHLKVHATFFMIGQQVKGHGALLKKMLRDGHELANHSWNHANLGGGGAAATRQIVDTNRAIQRASGFRPCLMRPPYGSTGRDLVGRVRAQKMTSVLWDVDPQDWRRPGVGTIVGTIRGQTRAGSIILEHDGGGPREQTLAALPQYVRTLKARGYKFVTVSELLGYRTVYRLAQ